MSLILNGTTGLSDVDGTAAAPAIRGTDANTGIFFPGADRIGFAGGGVQVGEFDASGNLLFNSGYGSAAVAYGCRAWVNFNGSGTPAIRASGNVSSIVDNGTGNYTVNFTTALPDANYAQVIGIGDYGLVFNRNSAVGVASNSSKTTTLTKIDMTDAAGSQYDFTEINIAIFR